MEYGQLKCVRLSNYLYKLVLFPCSFCFSSCLDPHALNFPFCDRTSLSASPLAFLTSGMSSSTLQAMWYGGKALVHPPLVQLRLTEPAAKGQDIKEISTMKRSPSDYIHPLVEMKEANVFNLPGNGTKPFPAGEPAFEVSTFSFSHLNDTPPSVLMHNIIRMM